MNHRHVTISARRGGRGSRKAFNGPIVLDGRNQDNVSRYNNARGIFIPDDDYLEYMRQKKIHIEEIEKKNAVNRWVDNLFSTMPHLKQKSGTYTFSGYAAVYGELDIEDEVIGFGAFDEDIYQNHITKDYGLKVCLGHDYELENILGYVENIKSDSHGVWVEGVLDASNQRVQQIKTNIENGVLNGLSIGYYPKKESFINDYKVLERGNLVEISLTPFPAQGRARITEFNGRMIC